MSSKANHNKRSHRSHVRHFGGARARLITARASSYKIAPMPAGALQRFRTKILPRAQKQAMEEASEA